MTNDRDLALLPKAHLHLHLEAAMRPETLREMSAERGLEAPELTGFTSFTDFDRIYRGLMAVLDSPGSLARLMDEAVEDAARDGAVYVELGIMPSLYRHVFASDEEALVATLDAAEAAAARHGVEVGLMFTIDRVAESPEEAAANARMAVRYRERGVVSLGLANNEVGFPAERFAEAFRIAREGGLLSTPHAGELVGPESVRAALDVLGADRVLHGVRAGEDPELVFELASRGVCLDVCPTSNVLLGVVPDLAHHPLPGLLEAGVRCSINADDPIIFGPGLLDEYTAARERIGLSDAALAVCAFNSIESSGASDALKGRAGQDIARWLAG